MKNLHLKAAVALTLLTAAFQARARAVRTQVTEQGDRGDGPIPFVIILLVTIAGAGLIGGTLVLLYGKYNGKVMGK